MFLGFILAAAPPACKGVLQKDLQVRPCRAGLSPRPLRRGSTRGKKSASFSILPRGCDIERMFVPAFMRIILNSPNESNTRSIESAGLAGAALEHGVTLYQFHSEKQPRLVETKAPPGPRSPKKPIITIIIERRGFWSSRLLPNSNIQIPNFQLSTFKPRNFRNESPGNESNTRSIEIENHSRN